MVPTLQKYLKTRLLLILVGEDVENQNLNDVKMLSIFIFFKMASNMAADMWSYFGNCVYRLILAQFFFCNKPFQLVRWFVSLSKPLLDSFEEYVTLSAQGAF